MKCWWSPNIDFIIDVQFDCQYKIKVVNVMSIYEPTLLQNTFISLKCVKMW